MMFDRWFARRPPDDSSEEVYRRIVAQGRLPEFYAGGGVPDSLDGRFEMLALHLFLVLHRLQRERADP
ncbi:MAG: ubiquinol-cytochrome C chaperone family protein, partial [Dongiaceae bacterium]